MSNNQTFSQRKGLSPIRSVIQVESIDEETRNGIWNLIDVCFCSQLSSFHVTLESDGRRFVKTVWWDFFKKPIDRIPQYSGDTVAEIRNFFFECKWFEVFNFVEFLCNHSELGKCGSEFNLMVNDTFEKCLVGYRFISGQIVDITTPEEVAAIELASNYDDNFKFVSIHISKAIDLYSDRINPDYPNSVKESISAVEAACSVITQNPKASLGDALKVLETNHQLHGALKEGFSKLYGYTSDADGIRHALTDPSTLKSEDAKFMLVACSAFVNYLKEKYSAIVT